jgi:hypothetical protein
LPTWCSNYGNRVAGDRPVRSRPVRVSDHSLRPARIASSASAAAWSRGTPHIALGISLREGFIRHRCVIVLAHAPSLDDLIRPLQK